MDIGQTLLALIHVVIRRNPQCTDEILCIPGWRYSSSSSSSGGGGGENVGTQVSSILYSTQ